jgi:GNAT superfamily N-acetyltransferase
MEKIQYRQLAPEHFDQLIALANHVHGDNYLDQTKMADLYQRSFSKGINASWVALDGATLVGFRLTIAAQHWQIDKWCTPEYWRFPAEQVCYFKCNTVDENYRGKNIGPKLLALSIEQAARQGSLAGIAHIWMASPGNSAFRYFSKCGGELVKEHPGKWNELCVTENYVCPLCGDDCNCVAAEMLLTF